MNMNAGVLNCEDERHATWRGVVNNTMLMHDKANTMAWYAIHSKLFHIWETCVIHDGNGMY